MKTFDMSGKTVMVTGASRGIGEAAARAFAQAGANVALLARSRDSIARIAGEIGDKAIAIPCDVSRFWEVQSAFDKAAETFGDVNILINNAGVIDPIGPLSQIDPENFARAIDINLMGVMHGMRVALPAMAAVGGGTIINISSGAATNAVEGWSAYCASKAAVLMLTRMGDTENRDAGLRVMGLSPGTVATDMQREIKDSGVGPVAKLDWEDHVPPEWPARALMWMCTAEADGFRGMDVSLREENVRKAVGLV